MENQEKEKTIGIYINTKDSITIENLVKEKQFTFADYLKMNKAGADSGNYMRTVYVPEEFNLTDKNNIDVTLNLFCVAEENGQNYAYYKTKA